MTITILGFGNVGKTIATMLLYELDTFTLNIMDPFESSEGAKLDFLHCSNLFPKNNVLFNDYEAFESSDFIFHTAGVSVPKGASRRSIITANKEICQSIFKDAKLKEKCMIIVISNPVDPMTYFTWKYAKLNKSQVIGTGTYLETIRFNSSLQEETSNKNHNSLVCGEHGESAVLIESHGTLNQIDSNTVKKLMHNTINAASKIKNTQGATFIGVSGCALSIMKHIMNNTGSILPVSRVLNDQQAYKLQSKEMAISLPCVMSEKGAEFLENFTYSDQELRALISSAQAVEQNTFH